MKSIASLVLSGWALAVPAVWSQSPATIADPDPFAEEEFILAEEELEDSRPKMVRVQVEYIEMAHETMTELMSGETVLSDNELRKSLRKLVKEKEARVIETQLVIARPGQKATVESNEEYIYPTEYEPAELPAEINVIEGGVKAELEGREFAIGPTPTAFETRNLGSILEIQPNLVGDIVDLRFAPELIFHVRNETWSEWNGALGKSPIQMPVIYSMRVSGDIAVRSGNYRLVAALSPNGPDGHPDFERKLLIFVRPDIVTVE